MNITTSLLRSLDACAEHRDAFAAAFPDGLTVTGEPDADAIQRIVDARLNVRWLCERVLTAAASAEYERVRAPASAEYDHVTAAASAEYERVTAAAWAEYRRVVAAALAEYRRVVAPAWAEYERVRAQARAEYDRVRAQARAEYERVMVVSAWQLLADEGNIRPPHTEKGEE